MSMPLFYELGAELMYPAKESTSAGMIVFIMNGVAGAMIALNTILTASNMNYIMLSIVAVLLVAILFGVKEEYKRPADGTPLNVDDEKLFAGEGPSGVQT